MANRKTHLRHQARRTTTGESASQQTTQKAGPSKVTPLAKNETAPVTQKPVEYTQLTLVETALVRLELRHRLYTVAIILIGFGLLWLLFHFTGVDEKIYSLFKLNA